MTGIPLSDSTAVRFRTRCALSSGSFRTYIATVGRTSLIPSLPTRHRYIPSAREGRDGISVADLAGLVPKEVGMNYERLIEEAREYGALCDRARAVGIDVVATDETSTDPQAIAKLRDAVEAAEKERS